MTTLELHKPYWPEEKFLTPADRAEISTWMSRVLEKNTVWTLQVQQYGEISPQATDAAKDLFRLFMRGDAAQVEETLAQLSFWEVRTAGHGVQLLLKQMTQDVQTKSERALRASKN